MSQVTDSLPPLTERFTVLGWLRKNLFNTWPNSLLSILAILFVYWAGRGLLTWIFTVAEWNVVAVNLRLFMIGRCLKVGLIVSMISSIYSGITKRRRCSLDWSTDTTLVDTGLHFLRSCAWKFWGFHY